MDGPQVQIGKTKDVDTEEKSETEQQGNSDVNTCSKPESVEVQKQEKKLCKYYIRKKCKYGATGKDCPYEHPKKCFKYMQNGNKSGRGCKRGNECTFYHPPLCKHSIKTGMCLKNDCKFHHLKGTKYSDEKRNGNLSRNTQINQFPDAKNVSKSKRLNKQVGTKTAQCTYANKVAGPQRFTASHEQEHADYRMEGLRYNETQVNFQDLRHQIQQMQIQMNKLLLMGTPTATTQCRCQGKCH